MYPTGSAVRPVRSNCGSAPNTGLPALTVPMGIATGSEGSPASAGRTSSSSGQSALLRADADLDRLLVEEQATRRPQTPSLYPALAGDVFPGPGQDDDAPGAGAVTVARSMQTVREGPAVHGRCDAGRREFRRPYGATVGYDAKAFTLVSAAPGTSGVSYTEPSGQRGDGDRHQARHIPRIAGPDVTRSRSRSRRPRRHRRPASSSPASTPPSPSGHGRLDAESARRPARPGRARDRRRRSLYPAG